MIAVDAKSVYWTNQGDTAAVPILSNGAIMAADKVAGAGAAAIFLRARGSARHRRRWHHPLLDVNRIVSDGARAAIHRTGLSGF